MNRKHISRTIKPHLTNHKIGVLKFQFSKRYDATIDRRRYDRLYCDSFTTREQHIKRKLDSDNRIWIFIAAIKQTYGLIYGNTRAFLRE